MEWNKQGGYPTGDYIVSKDTANFHLKRLNFYGKTLNFQIKTLNLHRFYTIFQGIY